MSIIITRTDSVSRALTAAVVLLIMVGFLGLTPRLMHTPGTTECWSLEQENSMGASWRVYLSNDGVVFASGTCTMIASAPKWNVVLYNIKTRRYYLAPLSDFGSLKATTQLFPQSPAHSNLKDQATLAYRAAFTWVSMLSSLDDDEEDLDVRVKETTGSPLTLTKDQGNALAGLPLSFQHSDPQKMIVFTKSVSKVSAPQRLFSTPSLKGYKRVDSEIAVLMDEKGIAAMEAIMEDLGEGSEDLDKLLAEPAPKAKDATSAEKLDAKPDTKSGTKTKTLTQPTKVQ